MDYEILWHRLTPLYETSEAKAIIRWVLDVRFGLSMADILCGKVKELSANDQKELETILQRLEKGEPVQYIIGVADFCGRQFHVEPGVLIPRPETEELCRWITQRDGSFVSMLCETQKNRPSVLSVLDIGTGSGCIAITLALEMLEAKVTAWDISDEALRIAQENAQALGAEIIFEHQDILNISLSTFLRPFGSKRPLAERHFPLSSKYDLIVSNPPYIQPKERDGMAKNVLDYEPHQALFTPEDQPIIFYQRIGDFAWQSLIPGGELYFELNPLTADEVSDYLCGLGFTDIEIRQDQFGKQRFLKATKK